MPPELGASPLMQVAIFVVQAVTLGVIVVHVGMNIAIARRQRAIAKLQEELLANDRRFAAQLAALRIVRRHDNYLQADVPDEASTFVHFRLLVADEIVCGADATKQPSRTMPKGVTCPACREWLGQNVPSPSEASFAQPRDGEEGARLQDH
jgi:hypothetical protein